MDYHGHYTCKTQPGTQTSAPLGTDGALKVIAGPKLKCHTSASEYVLHDLVGNHFGLRDMMNKTPGLVCGTTNEPVTVWKRLCFLFCLKCGTLKLPRNVGTSGDTLCFVTWRRQPTSTAVSLGVIRSCIWTGTWMWKKWWVVKMWNPTSKWRNSQ